MKKACSGWPGNSWEVSTSCEIYSCDSQVVLPVCVVRRFNYLTSTPRLIFITCMSMCIPAVKFFGGEDGRPWKSNVKDVGGELLLVRKRSLQSDLSLYCSMDYLFSGK
jgi:hypothetical protein